MAHTRPISECAQLIADRGFVLTDADVEGRLLEFEAINLTKSGDETVHLRHMILERMDD